jgi:hypothetical protein
VDESLELFALGGAVAVGQVLTHKHRARGARKGQEDNKQAKGA